jgi:hypothetical protein
MKSASPQRAAAARSTYPKVCGSTTPLPVRPASRGYPSRRRRGVVCASDHPKMAFRFETHRSGPRSGQAARGVQPRDRAPDSELPAACEASFAPGRSRVRRVSLAAGRPPLPPFDSLALVPGDPGLLASLSRPGRSNVLWKGTSMAAVFLLRRSPRPKPRARHHASRRLTIPTGSSVHPANALPVRRRSAFGDRLGGFIGCPCSTNRAGVRGCLSTRVVQSPPSFPPCPGRAALDSSRRS